MGVIVSVGQGSPAAVTVAVIVIHDGLVMFEDTIIYPSAHFLCRSRVTSGRYVVTGTSSSLFQVE